MFGGNLLKSFLYALVWHFLAIVIVFVIRLVGNSLGFSNQKMGVEDDLSVFASDIFGRSLLKF